MAPMELRSLSLLNYRNFASLELKVPSGLVLFVGDNAQGKSNLLEAVYLLAIAKSYRVATDRELIAWRAADRGELALVSGTVRRNDGQLEIIVGLEYDSRIRVGGGVRKQIRVNGIPRRASEMVGLLNAVLFSADDLELVYGSPSVRRRYLDVMLCQVSRPYLRALQRYQHVVTQRNSLLRDMREGRAREAELEFWDHSLCTEGAYLLDARYQAVAFFAPHVGEMYGRLMGTDQEMTIEYVTTTPLPGPPGQESARQAIAQSLVSSRRQERALAQTVVGPHRDDLRLAVAGVEMARSASRGQARLAALALRLAEGEFLSQQRGEPPVLLLDDIFSELDERRRTLVMEEVKKYPQTLVTTASAELLSSEYREAARRFQVIDGRVSEDGDGAGGGGLR